MCLYAWFWKDICLQHATVHSKENNQMNFIGSDRPVLVIEDYNLDVEVLKTAFKQLKVRNEVVVAKNGEEGIDYLTNGSSKAPCLIMIDLKMPGMSGFQFLDEVKKYGQFASIPTIILTASSEESDRLKSFQLSASGYNVKPREFGGYLEMLKSIHNYWSLNELPD